jgi:hypothetical protein
MKAVIYIVVLLILGSTVWWFVSGKAPDEQLSVIKANISHSTSVEGATHTADSASKLGKVLKKNFEEAQEVYQNGAEAKYE